MQTTFDCLCGASVAASGAWTDDREGDRTVGYRWHTEDATEEPDFEDLEDALRWTR